MHILPCRRRGTWRGWMGGPSWSGLSYRACRRWSRGKLACPPLKFLFRFANRERAPGEFRGLFPLSCFVLPSMIDLELDLGATACAGPTPRAPEGPGSAWPRCSITVAVLFSVAVLRRAPCPFPRSRPRLHQHAPVCDPAGPVRSCRSHSSSAALWRPPGRAAGVLVGGGK